MCGSGGRSEQERAEITMHGSPTGEDHGNSEKGKRRKFWPPLLYARRQIPDSLSRQEGGNRSFLGRTAAVAEECCQDALGKG